MGGETRAKDSEAAVEVNPAWSVVFIPSCLCFKVLYMINQLKSIWLFREDFEPKKGDAEPDIVCSVTLSAVSFLCE